MSDNTTRRTIPELRTLATKNDTHRDSRPMYYANFKGFRIQIGTMGHGDAIESTEMWIDHGYTRLSTYTTDNGYLA